MLGLLAVAPCDEVTEYDREQLPLYAALLDAEAGGAGWHDIAVEVMRLNPEMEDTELCVRTHLDRAHWIVGGGLELAIITFSPTH
jgi:hypothetical protein